MTRRFHSRLAAIAVLLGTTALSVPHASAATHHAGGGAGQRLQAALAQLDLSADQKKQVKQILASAAKPKAIAGAAAAPATARVSPRSVMTKIMAVLTTPQKAKFKQLMQAGRRATRLSRERPVSPDDTI